MWERTLSQKLVRLFCEQKVIDEAKTDAYVYGYELLISSIQMLESERRGRRREQQSKPSQPSSKQGSI